MAIKVEADQVPFHDPRPNYPYLGVSAKGRVVLFVAHNVGVLLTQNPADPSRRPVGGLANDWSERSFFRPYTGKVTLENDNG